MKQRLRRIQHCIQVHKSQEKSFQDYYFDYDPVYRTLKIRDGGPSGELLESYTYDDQNTRLIKTDHLLNETTYYISDEFIEVRNATGTYLTVYAYDGDTLLGRKDPSGDRFYYHPDHLGSTDLVTDENQKAFMLQKITNGGENEDL